MTSLSVVTPTYNRKDNLRRTLDGLARQTYLNDAFEVVVVSDGSTDGTPEMLTEYAKTAPFLLRWFQQENGGPSRARNRGIEEAQNDVVVFLDDDVEPIPEFLARHAAHHAADEKIVVLGPMSPDPANASNEPTWIAWEHAKLQDIYDLFKPNGEYSGHDAGPMHFYSGNASVRRAWLQAVGGFDPAFTRQEDVELAVRMERVCGVRFRFDFTADGLHRPTRTLAAWLKIPASYGRLDAERVQRGDLAWEDVRRNFRTRRKSIQSLVKSCRSVPLLSAIVPGALVSLAQSADTFHRRNAALAALSAVYNLRYYLTLLKTLNSDEYRLFDTDIVGQEGASSSAPTNNYRQAS